MYKKGNLYVQRTSELYTWRNIKRDVIMVNVNTKPFEDIKALIDSIPMPQTEIKSRVLGTLGLAINGLNPLGRLDDIVALLASWQGTEQPEIKKPLVAVFIGSHRVAQNVLGSDPIALAKQRVTSLSSGKAAVRGFAKVYGAAFKVYEMGIEHPAQDMSHEASLSERECAQAIAFGMEVVSEGADIIALGSAGAGTATAAAGIARGLYGGTADYWAGGTKKTARKRIEMVEMAARCHKDILEDPLSVLRCFGGRDIAGMVGAILAARHQKIPVLLDGFAVCAAAAILHEINPEVLDHCIAAHITSEPAHGALLDRINKAPLLDFGLGIGDGSGAALAIGVIKAAVAGNHDL